LNLPFCRPAVGFDPTNLLESITLLDNSAFKFVTFGNEVKVVYNHS
jgi:hypothetical protein